MTTDLTALLAAIVQNPDEDTPRLAYADALYERNRFVPAGSGGTDDRVIADRIKTSIQENWEPQAIGVSAQWCPLPKGMKGIYHRGFYNQVWCDAATFLRHADALVWYPGQMVECRDCGGDGEKLRFGCWTCARRGRVPRPCPPTAQPIRKVVLTTWPDDVYAFDFVAVDRADPGKGYTSPRWPGVEFELPGTGTTVGTEVASDDAESDYPPMDADEAGVRYT